MPDWTKTMQQTFEYYVVDPGTWREIKKIDCVLDSSISRDSTLETLGSASITVSESIGECYIRIYNNSKWSKRKTFIRNILGSITIL